MSLVLDSRIIQNLQEIRTKLTDGGKLPSGQELAEYYTTFRNKFGPEKLASLDGEVLLETLHGQGNRDSLAYWLEFKDDAEFPAIFGSISGGSAYKFGLFRRQSTGIWTTGSSQKAIELSTSEAIELARRHRDQLIAGADILSKFLVSANDEDYSQLQQDLMRVAPEVSDSAWGHKYFSLLYPDKLDDFHNVYYSRFHLIKLLQEPPKEEGRYTAAGRYIAIAGTLKVPVNILTTLLNERDGSSPYSYWRIGTTLGNNPTHSFWDVMRTGGFCAIAWSHLGDLTNITNDVQGKEELRTLLKKYESDKHAIAIGKATRQIFDFRHHIEIGDLILASKGARVLGVGRVTGTYRYDSSLEFSHLLPVEWLSLEEWEQPDQLPGIEGVETTVYRMKKPRNLIEAERRIMLLLKPVLPPSPGPDVPPTLVPLPHLAGIMAKIQNILERKGQLILYGPPGTGKTYWAEHTALELAARAFFQAPFDNLTAEQKATIQGENQTASGKVRVCCFHPAYGYEDFLEGFRPEATNGQMHFVPRTGIFKQLCQDAGRSPKENFYLIIDEINRGDVPRIFGELLTVLEKDKRGRSILLPLTQERFQVPENVYIIGTMNTADRSIALLDAALRRRFGFIELLPDTEVLSNALVGDIPLGPWLDALNGRIREYVGQDARNLQIGHAYFMEKGQPIRSFPLFARVIQEDILPLLEEYCYGDYVRLEKIIGSGLIDTKAQTIRYELFDSSQRDLLTQTLLAPCPEIITSARALAAQKAAEEEQQAEADLDPNASKDAE